MNFTERDWERIEEVWTRFWNNELGRPIVCMEYHGECNHELDLKHFVPQYPKDMLVEDIVNIHGEYIENMHYLGDAYPKYFNNFGAGSLAAYMGVLSMMIPSGLNR